MSKSTTLPSSPERRPLDLATGIVDALRQELAAGRYDSDTVFTELALSERFGVSRTPIREALLALERDGLLVQRGRSFGMPCYSAKQMEDVFVVRQQLEPYAIRRIVELQPAAKIDAFIEWARTELQGDFTPDTYIAAHQKVRTALLQLCRNAVIRDAIETFDHQTAFIRQQTLRHPDSLALSLKLTRQLLDALAKHDPDAAESAAQDTLVAAHEAIKRILQKA